jgi:hypothetical protein
MDEFPSVLAWISDFRHFKILSKTLKYIADTVVDTGDELRGMRKGR